MNKKETIAEILCVGTELLLGDICNTNAQYLARQLAHLGINLFYQTVVGDNPQRVKETLAIAFQRANLVILTGGLGPTKDDLTKEMVAEYFQQSLVFDAKAYEQLANRAHRLGVDTVSMSNKKQAYVPQGAIVLYNEHGTAPGFILERDNGQQPTQIAILLPGPPKEMRPMFETYCLPYLRRRSDRVFVSVNVKLKRYGEASIQQIGESQVADKISDLLDQKNPTVATYAKEDGVWIRITAAAHTHDEAFCLIEPIIAEIRKRLGDVIREIAEAE